MQNSRENRKHISQHHCLVWSIALEMNFIFSLPRELEPRSCEQLLPSPPLRGPRDVCSTLPSLQEGEGKIRLGLPLRNTILLVLSAAKAYHRHIIAESCGTLNYYYYLKKSLSFVWSILLIILYEILARTILSDSFLFCCWNLSVVKIVNYFIILNFYRYLLKKKSF